MGKILGISNSLVTLCVQFYYTKNLGGISNYNMDISRTPSPTPPPPAPFRLLFSVHMVCEHPRRKCNFPEERKMRYYQTYSRTNCEIERSIGIYEKLCNCKPYYFPGKHGLKLNHLDNFKTEAPTSYLPSFLSSWFVVEFHKLL